LHLTRRHYGSSGFNVSPAAAQVNGFVRQRRATVVEVVVLDPPDGNVLARGSYYGGPDYEFVVAADGHVDWRMVGDTQSVWAGPDADSFRRIAAAWNRYRAEVVGLPSEAAQLARVAQMRVELAALGALPTVLPPDPEPLWSLLVFEAEHGLG
jgi:hypothetical protein